jgi:hypothetical protein
VKRRLHVLTTPKERIQRIHLIKVLAGIWRERGDVVSFGQTVPHECDGVIAHTDYSLVHPDFFAGLEPGSRIINGGARDIRKSVVSDMLLSPESDWDGPVMIKTDANAHAGEEYAYHGLDLARLAKIFAARLVPWQWVGELPFRRYPILPRLADVPDWVWRDKNLVVDRFLPEIDENYYVLRLWMFFGDQEYCMKVRGELPQVKSRKLVSVELVEDVPDEVRAAREKHKLDFGKIDFVMHEGRALVFDVNKTPTVFLNKAGKPGRFVQRLANGLDHLL